MFESSEPRFRAQNANLMLAGVQLGSFLGPALGGLLVARLGYRGYFGGAAILALGCAAASAALARRRARPKA
jgi:MFS family permease